MTRRSLPARSFLALVLALAVLAPQAAGIRAERLAPLVYTIRFKLQDPAAPADPAKAWTLEVRPEATADQQAHFAAFLAHSKAR
jgi:hypothetical protein